MDEFTKVRPGRRSLRDWIVDIAMLIGSARTDSRLHRLRRGDSSGPQAPGSHEAAAFDQLYRETDGDPWRITTSGASYQAFKYDVLLACLPRDRFVHALDLGCGAGVLTRRLSQRCDAISGVDISAVAIALARERSYACPTVFEASTAEAFLTDAEPCVFDLIVAVDTLYYLAETAVDEAELDRLVRGLARLARPGGYVVVANHHVFHRAGSRFARCGPCARKHGALVRISNDLPDPTPLLYRRRFPGTRPRRPRPMLAPDARESAPQKRRFRSGLVAIGLTVVGLAGIAALLGWAGLGAVVDGLRRMGWLFLPIAALHILPITLDALAWRTIAPKPRPRLTLFMAARWLREGINALLPVAQIGGEVAAIGLLARTGLGAPRSAAILALDVLAEFIALAGSGLAGAWLLFALSAPAARSEAAWIVTATAPAVLVAGLLVSLPRMRPLSRLVRALVRRWPSLEARVEEALATAAQTWSRPGALASAVALHIGAWGAAAFETWVILRAIGHPVSPVAAFALATTSELLKGVGFVLPGLLAAQEGALILVGALLGVPPADALALSLCRRARDAVLGLPAVLIWRRLHRDRA